MSHDNQMLAVLASMAVLHYLADFVFQNGFMLMGKVKPGTAFIMPLSLHCLEHALPTALVFLVYSPSHAWVALIDFAAHFVVDRTKALYKIEGGVWKPENKIANLSKWYRAFGLDQLMHGLTKILLVYIAVNF